MLFITLLTAKNTERGAGMAEYALLLVLIAVALVAGFQGLATAINGALTATVNSF